MQSGQLRHSVILQKPDPDASRDAVGERTTTWLDVLTTWASIVPTRSTERHIAAQAHSFTTHRVTVRWCSDISAIDNSWRVLFGDRPMPVEGVRNLDERNVWVELECVESAKEE